MELCPLPSLCFLGFGSLFDHLVRFFFDSTRPVHGSAVFVGFFRTFFLSDSLPFSFFPPGPLLGLALAFGGLALKGPPSRRFFFLGSV